MAKCDAETKNVVRDIEELIEASIWYERVGTLKPTERKSGESERSWNARVRAENNLITSLNKFKQCKVK